MSVKEIKKLKGIKRENEEIIGFLLLFVFVVILLMDYDF